MKILLVGGAGFIGHNLALWLKRLAFDVYVLDGLQVNSFLSMAHDVKENSQYLGFLRERLQLLAAANIRTIVQDGRNYHEMSRVIGDIKPDVVVHLAAVAHANRSNKDPYSTFDHSLQTLEISLDICKAPALKGVVKQFIYFSSSMVYGDFPDGGQVFEDSPLNPKGIYGALKNAGELMVKAYGQVFDVPYTIIRPSALYGPRCVSGRVIQKFIEAAMAGQPLTVIGGTDRLDFTYIEDLVRGVTNAIGTPGAMNETFNITYGEARSVMEVAKLVQAQFGTKTQGCIDPSGVTGISFTEPMVPIVEKPRDKDMPERGTLVVDKARRRIGYDPAWPIEKGVQKYVKWYTDREYNNRIFP